MTRRLPRTVEQLLLVLVCTGCLMSTLPAEARADSSEMGGKDRTSALVASILAAYGGEKTLAEVHSVYSKGLIHTFLRDEKGISTRYFKHPRKLRAELFYPHASETRIINGYQGWRGSDTRTMREVTGPPYLAMVYQFKHLDFPFGFLGKGYTITGLGTEQLRGITVEVLQVSDDEGPTMRVYVDASSHLIARVAAFFTFGPVTSELSAEFSDYRDVAGIKFPFSIVNYSGKTRLAETTIIEVRFNTEMPETLFRP